MTHLAPQVPGAGLHIYGGDEVSHCSLLTAVAGHCPARAGSCALPQATEAWAEKDVFPHLKATGVFMRLSRGERHYNQGLHV